MEVNFYPSMPADHNNSGNAGCKRHALRPIRFSWPESLVSLLGILFLAALLVLDQTRIGEIILWRV